MCIKSKKNKHNYSGLKIHLQYVLKDTKLGEIYLNGGYIPLKKQEYIGQVAYVLTHLKPDIVNYRITGAEIKTD